MPLLRTWGSQLPPSDPEFCPQFLFISKPRLKEKKSKSDRLKSLLPSCNCHRVSAVKLTFLQVAQLTGRPVSDEERQWNDVRGMCARQHTHIFTRSHLYPWINMGLLLLAFLFPKQSNLIIWKFIARYELIFYYETYITECKVEH